MPIPLILGAAAIAAAFGVKKGLDAKKGFEEAKEENNEALEIIERSENSLNRARKAAQASLEALGRTKLALSTEELKRFIDAVKKIKNVTEGGYSSDDKISWSDEELREMQRITADMTEIAGGGVGALGAGGLTALATYGSVGLLASTAGGTAIGTLSGAAATNATLAWLGGGSLAAGGMGMAGGMAVLGGIVAGPALAVGGMMLASKAEEAKENARSNWFEALEHSSKLDVATTATQGMNAHIQEVDNVLSALKETFQPLLEGLEALVAHGNVDYAQMAEDDRKGFNMCSNTAHTIKNIINAPIFDEAGVITAASVEQIQVAKKLLPSNAEV